MFVFRHIEQVDGSIVKAVSVAMVTDLAIEGVGDQSMHVYGGFEVAGFYGAFCVIAASAAVHSPREAFQPFYEVGIDNNIVAAAKV